MQTYGQKLEEVEKAISAVMLNQRYEINGRVYQRADLESLQTREEYLIKKVQNDGDVTPISVKGSQAFKMVFS